MATKIIMFFIDFDTFNKHHAIPTLTVSKGCPTTREASPPIPPASKFAPGDARSLSRVVLWDELGGDAVVVLVADDDLEGDTVLLLSLVGLVA